MQANTAATLRVLSVHDHVINFYTPSWSHLFMICDPSVHRGPASIGLSFCLFEDLLKTIDQELPCRFDPGQIIIGGVDGGIRISLDGEIVSFVPPLPEGRSTGESSAYLEEALPALRRLANGRLCSVLLGDQDGLDAEDPAEWLDLGSEIRTTFPRFLEALMAGDSPALELWSKRLVGLGFGSTPTGDDLIHGALVALHYLERLSSLRYEAPVLPRSLWKLTTPLGAHMLAMGRLGLTPEPVGRFLKELCEQTLSGRTMGQLAAIGSDTGINIAVGAYRMLRNHAHRFRSRITDAHGLLVEADALHDPVGQLQV